MGFLRKLFKNIMRVFKKIWEQVKKMIAIILVAILIIALCYLPFMWAFELGWTYTTFTGLSIIELLMVGVGGVLISYLVMPNTTTWAIRRAFTGLRIVTSEVVETVGDITGDIVEAIGDVTGRALSSSGGLLLLAGAAAFLYLGKGKGSVDSGKPTGTVYVDRQPSRSDRYLDGTIISRQEGELYA